jgi:hypothetical protein
MPDGISTRPEHPMIEKAWIAAVMAAGVAAAQVSDQESRYMVEPASVAKRADGAQLIHYDLTKALLETTVNGAIWCKARTVGEGGNPSLAVWAVSREGGKVARVSETTIKPDIDGPVVLPVTRYLRDHMKDGAVSFLIESRSAPGFSKNVEFSGTPMLSIAKKQRPAYELRDLLRPVWKGARIENETILPVSKEGRAAEANLAFVPARIISVRNYALEQTYAEGRDYTVDGRTIRLLPGSPIAFLNHGDLYHNNPAAKPGAMKAAGGGFLTFSESSFFNDRQLAVTYEHAGTWDGPVPQSAKDRLPETFRKLKKGAPLKLAVFGDSISFGASASGSASRAPWMPRWADLVTDALGRAYGSRIDCVNASLGGTRSDWGRKTIDGLVSHEKPDLVILGFGMNDGGAGVSAEDFASNLRAMIESVRKLNPAAEFILLMSFQPNSKWRPLEPMPAYLEAMKAMEGPGVAVADVWSPHGYLLRHKSYADMSGNHVNHPNDFLVRVYAQVLLATLGVEDAPN